LSKCGARQGDAKPDGDESLVHMSLPRWNSGDSALPATPKQLPVFWLAVWNGAEASALYGDGAGSNV